MRRISKINLYTYIVRVQHSCLFAHVNVARFLCTAKYGQIFKNNLLNIVGIGSTKVWMTAETKRDIVKQDLGKSDKRDQTVKRTTFINK